MRSTERQLHLTMNELMVGFKAQREWGTMIVTYLFMGGAGAGIYLVSMAVGSAAGAMLGLATVAVACLVLLADLGHPERFWRAFKRPARSWISRGTYFIPLLFVASPAGSAAIGASLHIPLAG